MNCRDNWRQKSSASILNELITRSAPKAKYTNNKMVLRCEMITWLGRLQFFDFTAPVPSKLYC
jgi:hypothetical protein